MAKGKVYYTLEGYESKFNSLDKICRFFYGDSSIYSKLVIYTNVETKDETRTFLKFYSTDGRIFYTKKGLEQYKHKRGFFFDTVYKNVFETVDSIKINVDKSATTADFSERLVKNVFNDRYRFNCKVGISKHLLSYDFNQVCIRTNDDKFTKTSQVCFIFKGYRDFLAAKGCEMYHDVPEDLVICIDPKNYLVTISNFAYFRYIYFNKNVDVTSEEFQIAFQSVIRRDDYLWLFDVER